MKRPALKRSIIIVLSVVVFFAVLAAAFFVVRPSFFASNKKPAGGQAAVAPAANLNAAQPETPPAPIEAETNLNAAQPETPPAPPVPHAVVGEANANGLKPITFEPPFGDIFRVAYHETSGALLMAVNEPDGLHSIWKMSKDGTIKRVMGQDSRPGEIFLQADSTGQLFAGFESAGTLYRSEDGGDTWDQVAGDIDGAFWQIADDGNGTIWGALHAWNKAWLYRSSNGGRTWQVWKDFQKVFPEYAKTYAQGDDRFMLRHLHGVLYHGGKLFVGTGDVARFTFMTADDGGTWQKVWSEGFTAGAVMKDSNNLLLGPDRLQAHGLAIYDDSMNRTTEVWSPIPYGYAGYTYSLIDVDGTYYAAFHTETNEVEAFSSKFGVIASPNGFAWYPFYELGPVTHQARSDIFLADGGKVVYLSLDGSLYSFEPLAWWWFDFKRPFGAKKK